MQPESQWKFTTASNDLALCNQGWEFENVSACLRMWSDAIPCSNRKWMGVQGGGREARLLPGRLWLDGVRAGSR